MSNKSQIFELNKMVIKYNYVGELKNTFITTKCAHRFCEDCIKQSINEFHKC